MTRDALLEKLRLLQQHLRSDEKTIVAARGHVLDGNLAEARKAVQKLHNHYSGAYEDAKAAERFNAHPQFRSATASIWRLSKIADVLEALRAGERDGFASEPPKPAPAKMTLRSDKRYKL